MATSHLAGLLHTGPYDALSLQTHQAIQQAAAKELWQSVTGRFRPSLARHDHLRTTTAARKTDARIGLPETHAANLSNEFGVSGFN